MNKSLAYNERDFTVSESRNTRNKRIPHYVFMSDDNKVTANFFFTPGNVQTRGLIWDEGDIKATFLIAYPLANPVNNPRKLPNSSDILKTIIQKLKRGEYE